MNVVDPISKYDIFNEKLLNSANFLEISKLFTQLDQMMILHINQLLKPFKILSTGQSVRVVWAGLSFIDTPACHHYDVTFFCSHGH